MTAIKGPSLADLRTTLARQVDTLVGRVRNWSPDDWEQPSANPGWSNAETVRHLAESLVTFAIGVEQGEQAARPCWDLTGPGDRGPEPRAARLVLQGLFSSHDDSSASPIALLLHVSGRTRMEGRPGWRGADWTWDIPDEARTS